MGAARLWCARHAPAEAAGICYGQTDVAVSVPHEIAAARLWDSYRGSAPVHVWSSPLSRCRGPASHLATRLGVPHTALPALAEMHFGDWEGQPWSTIPTRDGSYDAWMKDWERVRPPGGETPVDVETRVRAWYRSLPHDASHVLIAHSGVVRALHVIVHGRSWPDAMTVPVPHLAWTEFPFTSLGVS